MRTPRAVHRVTLFPAEDFEAMKAAHPGRRGRAADGRALRHDARDRALAARHAVQCAALGTLTALDPKTRRVIFDVPLGTTEALAPLGLALPSARRSSPVRS